MANILNASYEACRRYALRVKTRLAGLPKIVYAIRFDDFQLTIESTPCDDVPSTERISWDEVKFVYAYKKDCFSVDQIRMELLDGCGNAVVVTEEMRGWKELVEVLPLKLPGCQRFEEWFSNVAFPAFEQNMTLLFDRTNSETPTKQ